MDVLFVAWIEVQNWTRYRGLQRVDLAATVYGITARLDADPERSNWLGKSSLLAAVPFVVFGDNPAETADGWITNGERDGFVRVGLSDGTTIKRSRKRGSSTQLEIETGEGRKLAGDAAQEWIEETIGLTAKDFRASCFIEQKKMSKFVTDKPGERYRTIFGWMRLEKVQAAAKRVSAKAAAIDAELTTARADAKAKRGSIDEILGAYFDDVAGCDLDVAGRELETVLSETQKAACDARASAEEQQGAAKDLDAWQAAGRAATKRAALVREADELEAKIEDGAALELEIKASREAVSKSTGERSTARRDYDAKKALACGAFPGECPVDGHKCPDTAVMNAARDANRCLLETARKAYESAATVCGKADGQRMAIEARRDDRVRELAKVQAIRKQAAELESAAKLIETKGNPPAGDGLQRKADAAWQGYQSRQVNARECARHVEAFGRYRLELDALTAKAGELEKSLKLYRQAFAILGRNGVQRRIAERARAAIESGANDLLETNGIALRVAMSWDRESGDLATQCDECGAAFPHGRKVKACGCGAVRGPKLVDELEVRLTARSGAAEDLAGGAIQLAAAAWLRAERSSRWSVAFIDEPFGSLDVRHRREFAAHLNAMLRSRYGFAQAFIVAHEPGLMDTLPGRIRVEATEDRSSVMVG